jgi:hypothetical protein
MLAQAGLIYKVLGILYFPYFWLLQLNLYRRRKRPGNWKASLLNQSRELGSCVHFNICRILLSRAVIAHNRTNGHVLQLGKNVLDTIFATCPRLAPACGRKYGKLLGPQGSPTPPHG